MVKRDRLFSLKKTPAFVGMWSRTSRRSFDSSAPTSPASSSTASALSQRDDAPPTPGRDRHGCRGPRAGPPAEIGGPSRDFHPCPSPYPLSHSDSLTVLAGNLSPAFRQSWGGGSEDSLGAASHRCGGGGRPEPVSEDGDGGADRGGAGDGGVDRGEADDGEADCGGADDGGCAGLVYSLSGASSTYEVEVDQERDEADEFDAGGTDPEKPECGAGKGKDWTAVDGTALLLRKGFRRHSVA